MVVNIGESAIAFCRIVTLRTGGGGSRVIVLQSYTCVQQHVRRQWRLAVAFCRSLGTRV
jgi:hypothetical protein